MQRGGKRHPTYSAFFALAAVTVTIAVLAAPAETRLVREVVVVEWRACDRRRRHRGWLRQRKWWSRRRGRRWRQPWRLAHGTGLALAAVTVILAVLLAPVVTRLIRDVVVAEWDACDRRYAG